MSGKGIGLGGSCHWCISVPKGFYQCKPGWIEPEVSDEISIDRFHKKDSQMYQVMRQNHSEGRIEVSRLTPGVLADALVKEMPEIEYAVQIAYPQSANTISVNGDALKVKGIYTGKDYFRSVQL